MQGEESWRPLFIRESGEASPFDVLHEGTPTWLDGSIWRWLMDRGAEGSSELVLRLERRLHLKLAEDADRQFGRQHTAAAALLDRYWKSHSPDERLTLLDAILRDMQNRARAAFNEHDSDKVRQLAHAAEGLNDILTSGASVWGVHVGPAVWGLVRRVNDTTAELVKTIGSPETDAARKIKSAWISCYRYEPNYDIAYKDAILAVEAVTIPVTVPDSPRASLGTVVGHIRDTAPRWSVGSLDAKEIASGETLLTMLKMLWHNQQRHALSDGTIVDVTREEAESAVGLAVLIMHWFTSGLVTKSDGA